MTPNPHNETEREQRLNDVLLEYVEAAQDGHAPARPALLKAHPDLRSDLEEFFASHDEVERLAAPLRAAAKERPPTGSLPAPAVEADRELGHLGDFRLLREIGRGGMGVVYEAEQISLRRRVALKVLPFASAIDSRQLQRFQNEALAAAHLRHENVVPVYAVGSERGVHYYAMQYVEGQSLAMLIAELRQLSGETTGVDRSGSKPVLPANETTGPYFSADPPETRTEGANSSAASISVERTAGSRRYFHWAAGLGRQAAVALEHAHQMGIVHRDIKPANLLLDPRGQLWVTDFGLAQFNADANLTMTGELLGTLRYASPEQALGRRGLVDHRSDVYSLGATLYELLTLRPIFDGRDRHELLRQIANDDPSPPRSIEPALPQELETIILKAVAKESAERYATAQDFADDLQRFLEDRPILARRPSPLEKATKWARRHRALVASVLVALLLSVAGLSVATVVSTRAYDRERLKAAEADEQRGRAEASFRQARRAVDQFAQIGAEELAGDPPLEGVRRRLLEAALTYYQDFVDQHRDDATIKADLEDSLAKVKTILSELTTLMGAGQYALLQSRDVQNELELSEFQREAVKKLDEKWHEMVREFGRLSPAERERRRLAQAREQETEVARLFTEGQRRRFKELALQERGPFAFSEPDVVAALKLTAEQDKQIRVIQDEFGPTPMRFDPRGGGRRGPPGPGGGPQGPGFGRQGPPGPQGRPDGPWREDAENRQRAQEKIVSFLSPEQKNAWNTLIGKPFRGKYRPGPPGGPHP